MFSFSNTNLLRYVVTQWLMYDTIRHNQPSEVVTTIFSPKLYRKHFVTKEYSVFTSSKVIRKKKNNAYILT